MPRLRASSPRSGKKEDQRSCDDGDAFFADAECEVVAVLSAWVRARAGSAPAAMSATQQAAARSRAFEWPRRSFALVFKPDSVAPGAADADRQEAELHRLVAQVAAGFV